MSKKTEMPDHRPTDDPKFNEVMKAMITIGKDAGNYRTLVAFISLDDDRLKMALSSNMGEGLPVALAILATEGMGIMDDGPGWEKEDRSLDQKQSN